MKDKKLSTELMDEIQLDFFYEIFKMKLSYTDNISLMNFCLETLYFNNDIDFFEDNLNLDNF